MKTKIIAWLTGLLTISLAAFGFVLSFNALTDLAAQHGISIPWLFPLIVEAAVIVFSLNATYRSLYGENARWQWTLIIGSSLLAGTFNVLHSQPDIVSRAMSAMPSLFLLLSFETFLGQVKHAVKLTNSVKSLSELTEAIEQKRREADTQVSELTQTIEQKRQELTQTIEQKQQELDTLVSAKQQELNKLADTIEQNRLTLEQLKADIKQAKSVQSSTIEQARQAQVEQSNQLIEQRRVSLVNILKTEGDIGVSTMADRLNTSRGTLYNDLSALAELGIVHKNGSGWEVLG